MPKPSIARISPLPDRPATQRQIDKLLTLLSINKLIDAPYEDGVYNYDIYSAVGWVNELLGVSIDELDELTNNQIGKCFKELE